MGHTIMHWILIVWVLLSAGFALVAKLTGMSDLIKILIKLLSIGAVICVVLDLLKVNY